MGWLRNRTIQAAGISEVRRLTHHDSLIRLPAYYTDPLSHPTPGKNIALPSQRGKDAIPRRRRALAFAKAAKDQAFDTAAVMRYNSLSSIPTLYRLQVVYMPRKLPPLDIDEFFNI